jgi:hypothetical protein
MGSAACVLLHDSRAQVPHVGAYLSIWLVSKPDDPVLRMALFSVLKTSRI